MLRIRAGNLGDRQHRRQRGAALVEAAIVMPLLIMITVGIWTTARAWNITNTLDHAAREAARHGATVVPWDGSITEVTAVADNSLSAARVDLATVDHCIGLGKAPCGFAGATGDDQVGVRLQIKNYNLDFVFFSFNVDLEGTGSARWEG